MGRRNISKFIKKYQVWFYRLILIGLILVVPIYGERLFYFNKTRSINGINELYNESDILPSKSYLFIGNNENTAILDSTLKTIFPNGTDNLTAEAKSIEVMRYVASSLKHENNSGNATKILKDGYAICGGKSYAFRILLRKLGIPVRYVGLHYTPAQGGHDLGEVYYDNSWHLFDPTFGNFVYSNPTYDQQGHIYSMAELRQNNQMGYMQQVLETPWTGEYSRNIVEFGVQPIKNDYLLTLSNDFNSYWRNEVDRDFPVAYGEDSWVSIPVDVDLENHNHVIFGEKDKSHIDLSLHKIRFQGYGVLGKSIDTPGIYNTWSIKTKTPQKILIKYWSSKPLFSDIKIIPLRSTSLSKIERGSDNITVTLEVLDNPGIFIAIVPDGAFVIDAIEVFKE